MRKVLQDEKDGSQTERVEEEVVVDCGYSASNEEKHVGDRIMDHSKRNRKWKLKVGRHGFTSKDDILGVNPRIIPQ